MERALQHIEEARKLSEELGGTDKDVKDYFFNLNYTELNTILDAYGNKYGQAKREYAEATLPNWRSGRVKMSGDVAGRLFSMLPAYMPISKKYDLVKSLWEAKCPHSTKTLYIGPDADPHEVISKVRQHLLEVVQNYAIPDSIANRFSWLAQDDAKLQQDLHNYFLQLNRDFVTSAADDRLPRLLATMQGSESVKHISQKIQIGNHLLDLIFNPAVSGITSEAPKKIMSGKGTGCLLIIFAFIPLLVLLAYVGFR